MSVLAIDNKVITKKLRGIKSSPLRTVSKLHPVQKLDNLLPEKKRGSGPEEEIPFEKWIMPPQPEKYIKGKTYDFL